MITADALHRIGIEQSPEEFEEAIRRVIAAMPVAEQRAAPGKELTLAEVEALKRGGFNLERVDYGVNDPYLRGTAIYAALVAGGLSVAAVATMLCVDESRVRQHLAKRTLYGVKLDGAWRMPTFQFENGCPLPGIDAVVSSLPTDLNPVAVYQWFTLPDVDLVIDGESVSPREWLLRGGDVAAAVPLASSL